MAAPREIPGFYFNVEKNRYFPIKDPIPGRIRRLAHPVAVEEAAASSSSSSSREDGKAKKGCHVNITRNGRRTRVSDLLQFRELYGRLLMFNENRCFFEQEYEKLLVSHSLVWKYQNTDLLSDSALEQFYARIQTPEGQKETDVLLMGSKGGSFSLYGVGNLGHHLGYGFSSTPQPVFPISMKSKSECNIVPGNIWTSTGVSTRFPSSVSSILKLGAYSHKVADHNPCQNALVTTLGSGDLGGSVYFLNFNEALDFSSNVLGHQRISKISSYDFTIWTGASNSSGTEAALGTNQGAALLSLETGRLSWLYRTKSDIFSQKFDQSGNVVLSGLRNGSILAIDVRQKPSGSRLHFTSSTRDPVEPTSEGAKMHQRKHHRNRMTRRHQLKGDPSCHCASMRSAVCSLVPLHSDEQYFLGSSMDGSIELFDLRLLHRGPVQSYEGHANSHSHLELGVDPSEAFLLSGGEDCYLRIWSIKSGRMLFKENVSDSVLKTVCWLSDGNQSNGLRRPCAHGPHAGVDNHDCEQRMGGAWLGSREGLFYLNRA